MSRHSSFVLNIFSISPLVRIRVTYESLIFSSAFDLAIYSVFIAQFECPISSCSFSAASFHPCFLRNVLFIRKRRSRPCTAPKNIFIFLYRGFYWHRFLSILLDYISPGVRRYRSSFAKRVRFIRLQEIEGGLAWKRSVLIGIIIAIIRTECWHDRWNQSSTYVRCICKRSRLHNCYYAICGKK